MVGVRADSRSLVWWSLLAAGAAAAAAMGSGIGTLVAQWVGDGFRFDWYVHPGVRGVSATAFAFWAGRVAAAAALAGAALALLVLYIARWRGVHAAAPAAADARTRGVHARLCLLLAPLASGLVVAEFLWLRGGAGWGRASFGTLLPVIGGVSAAVALVATWLVTWRGLARGRIVPARPGDTLAGRVMLHAARHRHTVLALTLVLSLVAAYGASGLTADVDVVDVLPRGDPNTDAAHNLTERFKPSFTLQVTLHVRINPDARGDAERSHLPYRATEPAPANITDEVYVRAMDEMVEFLKSYVPEGEDHAPFRSSVGLPSFYRLINWTVAGGKDAPAAAYALPTAESREGSSRYAMVHDGVWRLIPDAATAVLSPDFAQAAVLMMVSPDEEMTSQEIGHAALAARDAYVAWADSDPDAYKVFTGTNPPEFTVDVPVANAHQSDLAERDFRLLLPLIGLFIAACLWVQFRDVRVIGIAFSALAVSTLWTFSLMGYLGLPLNTVNLTVVPLIMGVGIDYGIHVLNEHQHMRASGWSREGAFRRIGSRSGLSLFIATTTSILGVMVMIVSPSLLIAQLGFLCCVALATTYLLTVTFVPAAAAVLDHARTRTYHPSVVMRAVARGVGANRVAVVAVVGLVVLAAYASSTGIEREPFGDPPRNWLEDDPLREEHERAGKGFYASPKPDAKANVLIFEGDVMHPDAHAYMDALEAALKEEPRVIEHTLRTVPFILRTYMTVREGTPGAAQYTLLSELGQHEPLRPAHPYPDTREEIVAIAEEAHATPFASSRTSSTPGRTPRSR